MAEASAGKVPEGVKVDQYSEDSEAEEETGAACTAARSEARVKSESFIIAVFRTMRETINQIGELPWVYIVFFC